MKRNVFISLICSLIAAVTILLGVLLVMVFTDVIDAGQNKLVISSSSSSTTYDGKPLTSKSWRLLEGELKDGHTLKVTVNGSQTNVGVSENYITAKVVDEKGKDVTKDYNIEYRPGSLNVKPRALTIIAGTKSKIYDGKPLTDDSYTLASSLALLPSDVLDVKVSGTITEIGRTENVITKATVKNKKGEDVTHNYAITTEDGELIVYSEETIIISTESMAKEYDGTPLTQEKYELVAGKLAPNHRLDVKFTGTITNAGEVPNSAEFRVLDDSDREVSGNYNIVIEEGNLKITPIKVTLTTKDANKVYDGAPLTDSSFEIDPPSILTKGYEFVPYITGEQTEIGSSDNTVETCYVYLNGTDITENFSISYELGIDSLRKTRVSLIFRMRRPSRAILNATCR